MKSLFTRIFYRLILYLDSKTDEAKIYYRSKNLILGPQSKLYKDSLIYNMQGKQDLISVGEATHICGELLTFNYGGKITIGDNSFVGPGTRIWSGEEIIIGSNVLISHNINIMDNNAHEINFEERAESYKKLHVIGYPKVKGSVKTAKVIIKDNVWICFNSTILKGVTIGEGAIIGANSLVTKDVPPFTMVAGNPAVQIKKLNN